MNRDDWRHASVRPLVCSHRGEGFGTGRWQNLPRPASDHGLNVCGECKIGFVESSAAGAWRLCSSRML